MDSYFSHGKILLSAEYLIMFGAKALAFPVRYGQSLETYANAKYIIDWSAHSPGGLWFTCEFDLPSLQILSTSDKDKALYLQKLLKTIQVLNPQVFNVGVNIKTSSDFNMEWGLGSSSTLIANLASWAQVDPYKLFYGFSKGSGYDIACASRNRPIFFERNNNNPIVKETSFNKPFLDNLYLVYSGLKKPTEKHLAKFQGRGMQVEREIEYASRLTERFALSETLKEFMDLMREHEMLIADVIGELPVQKKMFSNYEGAIKSLGAWGGDFYLAATPNGEEYNTTYFEQFRLSTIIPFNKIALI